MKTKMILACAGMAACAAQGQTNLPTPAGLDAAATLTPVTVQPILGVTMDNRLILGEERPYTGGAANSARGVAAVDVYNAAGFGPDTDGDGTRDPVCGDLCGGFANPLPSSRWFFGNTFAMQAYADDIEFDSMTIADNPAFSGFTTFTSWSSCDGGTGSEPLVIVYTMYDSVDLVADLDGVNDGFDNDGDGIPETPYSRTDADGDGIVDEFTGGVVVTFANIDTDGDGAGDVLDASVTGYYVLNALLLTDTDGDGVPGDPGAGDFGGFPAGDRDGDGNPDGTVEVFYTSGEGPDTDGDGDGDGPIFGTFVPAVNNVSTMFWGTPDVDNSGCGTSFGFGGASGGIIWGQGQNLCDPADPNAGAGWSDGALIDGGEVNNLWDVSIDVTDFTGQVACPDPLSAALMIQGEGASEPPRLCADTNNDGMVSPADFNAWIIAFNGQTAFCDQNNDGLCTPADFNAWIINFNQGANGPTCTP